MPLLAFPNELLLLIAEFLRQEDLYSLLRANRHLANLLIKTLRRFAVHDRCIYGQIVPALHWATWKGYEPLVRLLLDLGFEVDAKMQEHGRTALHYATWQGHEAIIRLLLDRGAAIDACNNIYGRSVLHLATLRGCGRIVELLLEKGADVCVRDSTGQTALIWAARLQGPKEPFVDVFRMLLENGAAQVINAQEYERGETALHCAVQNGHLNTVRLFLEKGASTAILNYNGEAAIDLALTKENDEIVELLLEKRLVFSELEVVEEEYSNLEVVERYSNLEVVEERYSDLEVVHEHSHRRSMSLSKRLKLLSKVVMVGSILSQWRRK